MRVAYLTTDEVNQDLALALAESVNVRLLPLAPREAPPDGACDAVLYDLDYLPAVLRAAILTEALAGRPERPLGLHSYNLDAHRMAALQRNGVVVSRRLGPGLFTRLRRAVTAGRVADLLGGEATDQVAWAIGDRC